jgi:hypothetical protein
MEQDSRKKIGMIRHMSIRFSKVVVGFASWQIRVEQVLNRFRARQARKEARSRSIEEICADVDERYSRLSPELKAFASSLRKDGLVTASPNLADRNVKDGSK